MIKFPTLFNIDAKSGNRREWFINCAFIEIANAAELTKIQTTTRDIDWKLDNVKSIVTKAMSEILTNKLLSLENENKLVKFKDSKEFIAMTNMSDEITKINEVKKKYIGLYWYEGKIEDGKETKYSASFVTEGKNLGKKNETTIFIQTIFQCMSEYCKKKDKGYKFKEIEEEDRDKNETCLMYPMALHKWTESKTKIAFPCYVQPKLDGVRVLITLNNKQEKDLDKDVLIYSRKLKPYLGLIEIKKAIYPVLQKYPGLYLDGELYKVGQKFENFIGNVRNEEVKEYSEIQFFIFDSFIIEDCIVKQEIFEERKIRTEKIYKEIDEYLLQKNENNYKEVRKNPLNSIIVLVQNILVTKEETIETLLDELSVNYEGIVIRDKRGIYETSINREIRTYGALKYKKFLDDEYKIVGFTQGDKGKEIGAIKWILETNEGKQFMATPNDTLENRRKLFDTYTKNKNEFEKVKNKMATIRYQELSAYNIPRFAKFITIRTDL
jgi:DNA ligase-1